MNKEHKNIISNFPRILVVGAQFSSSYGSGIFTTHLFSTWPSCKLASVSATMYSQNWEKCPLHYCTGDGEMQIRKPFNRLAVKKKSGPINRNGNACEDTCTTKEKNNNSLLKRVANVISTKFLYLVGGRELLYKVVVSKQLTDWISAFNPDVIYGVCSDYNSTRFLRALHLALKIPLVLHVMDDWPSTLYTNGPAKYMIKPRYVKEYQNLAQQADVVVAICDIMAEEYTVRYRRPVISFPMPVDLDSYRTVWRSQWERGERFKIRYGGRVGWAIRDSLADFASAVDFLSKEGFNIVFEIATNQIEEVPNSCRELACVDIVKLAPLVELPQISAQCDLHLICYDFDDESIKQAKYSMPGKLAACMASGTPILVYGPPSSPVVEYAREENWGRVVSSSDPKMLIDGLRGLLEDESLRESYGRKARALAFKRHDAVIVSNNFNIVINSIVNKY